MSLVVEYSPSQKAFHLSTVQERRENELICASRGIESDYAPIHYCLTYEEADAFIDEERKRRP